jgi:hypothetical protein
MNIPNQNYRGKAFLKKRNRNIEDRHGTTISDMFPIVKNIVPEMKQKLENI